MANTYGTWLPGDPRGFRTRGHREHVDGDYKRPPTHDYSGRHKRARQQMKRLPVVLGVPARPVALQAIRHALVEVHELELIAIAVGAVHMHLLGKFPPAQKPTDLIRGLRATDPVRHYVGIAKKESAKRLAETELVERGGVWARRGKIVRIKDQRHQRNVFQYILDHADEGAAVWSFRDEQ